RKHADVVWKRTRNLARLSCALFVPRRCAARRAEESEMKSKWGAQARANDGNVLVRVRGRSRRSRRRAKCERTMITPAGWVALWLRACGATAACSKSETKGASQQTDKASATSASLTVGFVYVGPRDDFGYNQAHAEGARALAALPGVRLIEEEKVPET